MLLQSKEHFPEKSELWLKDLVTFLNMKLESVPETDKYLKPENKGRYFHPSNVIDLFHPLIPVFIIIIYKMKRGLYWL